MTGEEGRRLTVGDIVQIADNPGNLAFAYCMLVVSEIKSWGVVGHVQALGTHLQRGGRAYYRALWAEIEHTGGKACWLPPA